MTPQEKLEKLAEVHLDKCYPLKHFDEFRRLDAGKDFKAGYTTRDAELSAAAEREKDLIDALKFYAQGKGTAAEDVQDDPEVPGGKNPGIKARQTLAAYSAKEK